MCAPRPKRSAAGSPHRRRPGHTAATPGLRRTADTQADDRRQRRGADGLRHRFRLAWSADQQILGCCGRADRASDRVIGVSVAVHCRAEPPPQASVPEPTACKSAEDCRGGGAGEGEDDCEHRGRARDGGRDGGPAITDSDSGSWDGRCRCGIPMTWNPTPPGRWPVTRPALPGYVERACARTLPLGGAALQVASRDNRPSHRRRSIPARFRCPVPTDAVPPRRRHGSYVDLGEAQCHGDDELAAEVELLLIAGIPGFCVEAGGRRIAEVAHIRG